MGKTTKIKSFIKRAKIIIIVTILSVSLCITNRSFAARGKTRTGIIHSKDPPSYESEKKIFSPEKQNVETESFLYYSLIINSSCILLGATLIVCTIRFRNNFLRIKNKSLENSLYIKSKELTETNTLLEAIRDKLKNEIEYQQKIMESITHDIATPVKFIAMLSNKLNDVKDVDLQKKYFNSISKTSEQLFKFTIGLKEYSELYNEDKIFDSQEYSLYNLVESKKLLFEEIAFENNTIITNLCDPSLRVRANKNILSVILHNLIDNAVKNTIDGEIFIDTTINTTEVEIKIFDTGNGMSLSQIKYYSYIFDEKETIKSVFKRYGLGLQMMIPLSKKIKTKISFHDNIPKGTIVKILLKLTNYEEKSNDS